jgi:hypothetical protein
MKFSSCRGEVLFFAPPKKSTQKKGGPEGLPGTPSAMISRGPCVSRRFGSKARTLSDASRSGMTIPLRLRVARAPAWGGTQGTGVSRRGQRVPCSLGTFSWACKRKYLARQGDTGDSVQYIDSARGLQDQPAIACCMAMPISAGERTTVTPAASRASILAAAVPWPPLMMAPAWPMRLPGGAVTPAI